MNPTPITPQYLIGATEVTLTADGQRMITVFWISPKMELLAQVHVIEGKTSAIEHDGKMPADTDHQSQFLAKARELFKKAIDA